MTRVLAVRAGDWVPITCLVIANISLKKDSVFYYFGYVKVILYERVIFEACELHMTLKSSCDYFLVMFASYCLDYIPADGGGNCKLLLLSGN